MVSWDNINYNAGALSSVLLPINGNPPQGNHYHFTPPLQNVIYVTDKIRGDTCVGVNETTKTDEYRLYLNSHKIVPYKSPSGNLYMIYAYCYPGKKEHLYLGYAQYIIDSNHQVLLLTKNEFKTADNDGWGDSFGYFNQCSRIISMELRNGHLWITFMKDTGTDATGGSEISKQNAGCYYYFHIKASDLVGE